MNDSLITLKITMCARYIPYNLGGTGGVSPLLLLRYMGNVPEYSHYKRTSEKYIFRRIYTYCVFLLTKNLLVIYNKCNHPVQQTYQTYSRDGVTKNAKITKHVIQSLEDVETTLIPVQSDPSMLHPLGVRAKRGISRSDQPETVTKCVRLVKRETLIPVDVVELN